MRTKGGNWEGRQRTGAEGRRQMHCIAGRGVFVRSCIIGASMALRRKGLDGVLESIDT